MDETKWCMLTHAGDTVRPHRQSECFLTASAPAPRGETKCAYVNSGPYAYGPCGEPEQSHHDGTHAFLEPAPRGEEKHECFATQNGLVCFHEPPAPAPSAEEVVAVHLHDRGFWCGDPLCLGYSIGPHATATIRRK